MKVPITTAGSTLLAEGSAVFDASSQQWLYTAVQSNATPAGSFIKATAADRPGKTQTLEKVVEAS
jgi:hypothetical protein